MKSQSVPAAPSPFTFAAATLAALGLAACAPPAGRSASSLPRLQLAQAPLSFEVNAGQTTPRVKFIARGPGYALFLSPDGAVLGVERPSAPEPGRPELRQSLPRQPHAGQAELRLSLVGADKTPMVEGVDLLAGRSNYFIGSDPRRWRTGIPHYARVRYRDVYPGVDLLFHGAQGELEYDLLVQPGSDPSRIRLRFDGADSMALDQEGHLVLTLADGEVRQRRPEAFQETGGGRRSVRAGYTLTGPREVAFELGEYDRSHALVIDPILSYSTYLGGGYSESAVAVAVDGAGSAYVTGRSFSLDFPTANALQPYHASGSSDAFVTKLSPSGDGLVYSTYLGGSGFDQAWSIAVDASGSAYVTGDTNGPDFPVVSAFQSFHAHDVDVFVSKLAPDGSALVYSTYLGGSGVDGGLGIAVDEAGSAYITGYTNSGAFPLVNPLQPTLRSLYWYPDAFVTKLRDDGLALVYSTYLGGLYEDRGTAIAVDPAGRAYITGFTWSSDFPTASPMRIAPDPFTQEAFVAKLDPSGTAFVYSTYLGGSGVTTGSATYDGSDMGLGIAADAAGNAYVAGVTNSFAFPVRNPVQPIRAGTGSSSDGFVSKISAEGSGFVYSTYLGGASTDTVQSIALDSAGQAFVTGYTDSSDFPRTRPLEVGQGRGSTTGFVAKISVDGGVLAYSTYLGGTQANYPKGIAVDAAGSAYVTGWTYSLDFPTVNAFQAAHGINQPNISAPNGFVAKISDGVTPNPRAAPGNGRVEQTDPAVQIGAGWFSNASDQHSGGAAVLAVDRGSRVALTFSGTGVRWIGYRDEWSGIARVYLDGFLFATVDTYASPSEAQAVSFATDGLAPGLHTIVVECANMRTPASGGAWIWVDGFDVVPAEVTRAPGRHNRR